MTIQILGKYVLVTDRILKIESPVSIVLKKLLTSITQKNSVKIVPIILYLTLKLQDVCNSFTSHYSIPIPNQECLDMIIIL